MKNLKQAFTLVELIIVITILAILGAIAFISLQGYTRDARDSKRIADLRIIEKSLKLFELNTGFFPAPEGVRPDSTLTGAIEGIFGESNFMQVGKISELPKDPVTDKTYKYFVSEDGKSFRIETELEDGSIFSVGNLDLNKLLASNSGSTSTGETLTGNIDPCSTPTDASFFTFDQTIGTITSYSGSGPKDVCIPDNINGVSVTKIGNYSFAYKELTSVNIPNSIVSIGNAAFSSNKLTSILIPNSVTEIGDGTFAGNLLTSLTIPNSIKIIGKDTFAGNKLINLNLPNSIISIGQMAFQGNQLTSILIPNSITSIGSAAFSINQLTSIEIPNSVTSIGPNAFSSNKLTSILIPNSVTSIGYSAFNRNLLDESQAFIYARKNDGSEDRSFLVSYGGAKKDNVIIPDGVKNIGNFAFHSSNITSVTIPNSITSIGDNAFWYNKLTNITIPNLVTNIGSSAFRNNQLTSVIIPNSIVNLGASSFKNNQFTSVNIPNSNTKYNQSTNLTDCFDSGVTITRNP